MATQDHTIAGSGYGNVFIDSLVWGSAGWTIGTPITYYLANIADRDAAHDPNPGGALDNWSASETTAFTQILANYSAVCGLTFAASATLATANLVEWQVDGSAFSTPDVLGDHEVPLGGHSAATPNQIWGRFNFSSPGWASITQGGDGYNTLLHEIGHGMGLAHPHDGGSEPDATLFPGVTGDFSTGTDGQNQGPFTVMSYNSDLDAQPATTSAFGFAGGLGAFDIAALQAMYGANTSFHTGADTYLLPAANAVGAFWSSIWDAGGIDTLSNAGSALASVIDLRGAPLTGVNAGGFLSEASGIQGGFTIAHNAVIENAVGGNAADALTGNAAANTLTGNGGNDFIIGLEGADILFGGAGNDILYGDERAPNPSGIALGSGALVKNAGAGNSSIAAAINISSLFSLAANADIANAATVPHVSITGSGDGTRDFYKVVINNAGARITADIDHSSGGLDSFVTIFDASGAAVASNDDSPVTDGAGGSAVTADSLAAYVAPAPGVYFIAVGSFPDLSTLITGEGYVLNVSVDQELNASVFGAGNGIDTLYGGAGNDTLSGGAGNDIFDGGTGDDTESGGGGNDNFRGSAGADRYDGGTGTDLVTYAAASGVNVFLDGSGTNGKAALGDIFTGIENIIGGVGVDFLVGDGNSNRLTGGTGADVLWGRGGIDILEGGDGIDRLVGGAGNDVLVGGNDGDFFVFDMGPAAGGFDRTGDFVHGLDRIEIDASQFGGGLAAGGTVQLVSGPAPSSAGIAGGVFLYNTGNGFLSYDADGLGAGAAVAFFRLQNLPGLTAADFSVVA